ncbi:MAG: M56 family metallopeptidase [Lysobacterales bacterium]
MTDLLVWLTETTLVVGTLIAIVCLVGKPVAAASNVRWGYLIWTVPAARLALSMLPEPLATLPAAVLHQAGVPQLTGFDLSATITALPEFCVCLALAAWVAGVGIFGLRLMSQYAGYYRSLMANSAPLSGDDQKKLAHCCQQMQVFPVINCRQSPTISGPLLLGLLRSTLVLPTGFFQTSPAPVLVIRHELIHFRRRDLWSNLAGALIRCLFWFVPLTSWAERRFRDDQEIACDRAVLLEEKNSHRKGYVHALIQSTAKHPQCAAAFVGPEPALKQRARAVVKHRTSFIRDLAGATITAALAIFGLTLGVDSPAIALDWIPPLTFPAPLPGPCS